jgi:hypothetical protein
MLIENKRALVALFMESPLYIEMRVKERLILVTQYAQRLSKTHTLFFRDHLDTHAGINQRTIFVSDKITKIIAGYFPS